MVELVVEKIRAEQMLVDVAYEAITQHTSIERKKTIYVAGRDCYLDGLTYIIPGDSELAEQNCYRVAFDKGLNDLDFKLYLVFDIVDTFVKDGRLYERLQLRKCDFVRNSYPSYSTSYTSEELSIDWESILINNKAQLNSPLKLTRHYTPNYILALNKDSYIEDLKKTLLEYKNDLSKTYGRLNRGNHPSVCVKNIDGRFVLECYTVLHYEDKYHIHAFIELFKIDVESDDKLYFEASCIYPSYSSKIEDGCAMSCLPNGYSSLDEYLYSKHNGLSN